MRTASAKRLTPAQRAYRAKHGLDAEAEANGHITIDNEPAPTIDNEPTPAAPRPLRKKIGRPFGAKTRNKYKTAKFEPRTPDAQSTVTTGQEILPGVDPGSEIARRYYDIASAIVADQGGIASITEVRLHLIRRFAAAAVLAELMEARLARGENISVQEHAFLTSSLCRIVQRIGIDRRSKDVTPLLKDILSDPSLGEGIRDAQDEVDAQTDAGAWP